MMPSICASRQRKETQRGKHRHQQNQPEHNERDRGNVLLVRTNQNAEELGPVDKKGTLRELRKTSLEHATAVVDDKRGHHEERRIEESDAFASSSSSSCCPDLAPEPRAPSQETP